MRPLSSRETELKYLISLHRLEHMEQKHLTALMEYFGSAETAWKKYRGWGKILSLPARRLETMIDSRKEIQPEKLWDYAKGLGVKFTTVKDDDYPDAFREIYDVPYLLYYFGTLPEQGRFAFTVVGARKCDSYGRDIAKKFATDLVRRGNAAIVAGMAEGIDAAAHWAALNAGGETIAILGNGIDVIYPSINTKLYMQLKERGCLISEFPLGAESLKHHFPRRNRLMSALGNGVVVVEGTRHSGVFHTVSHGLEQGKEIYAVPGSIFQGLSYAPHFLIKEGTAKLITCADDILEDFMDLETIKEIETVDDMDFSHHPPAELRVLEALKQGPLSFDEIEKLSGLPSSKVSALLTEWEMDDLVRQEAGRIFSLCNYVQEVSHE